MPRFVLLYHDCPPEFKQSHWDFMLEIGGVLRTWELRELPRRWREDGNVIDDENGGLISALRLPDHRLDYLEYEGSLTHGRGSVKRVDRGEYELLSQTSGFLVVRLHGESIRGFVELLDTQQPPRWQLTVRQ